MTNLISIQDKSPANALFGGVSKYVLTKNFKLNGSNIIKSNNKTAQPTYTSSDGAGTSKFIKAYNRKKVEAQYSAFTNPGITVDLLFKYDDKDITTRTIKGNVINMLSLQDLMLLVMTPKTYYIVEDSIISQLSSGSNPFYSTYGFPVVISNWGLTVNSGTKDVTVNLTLTETVDEYI